MSSLYPLWIEKMFFLGLIATAVYVGILLQEYLSGATLWATRICVLPVVILVATEAIGRIIQSVYLK